MFIFQRHVARFIFFRQWLYISCCLFFFSLPCFSQTPSSTNAPIPAPCGDLVGDDIAVKRCQAFLNDPDAPGSNTTYSHAFVVSTASELRTAVSQTTTEGGGTITSRIIILRDGVYALPRQVSISHKVAVVGEIAAGPSYPVIKAGTGYQTLGSFVADSLFYLQGGVNLPSDIGFYSYNIHWDTTPPSESGDYSHESAISNESFPGEVRLVGNIFTQSDTESPSSEYVTLTDSTGEIYIGYNHFDTTHLGVAAVYADCQHCFGTPRNIEIAYNDFNDSSTSRRKRSVSQIRKDRITGRDFRKLDAREKRQVNDIPIALDVRHYKLFNIHHNRQLSDNASALIDIELSDNTSGVSAFIRDNIALMTAPANERAIYLTVSDGSADPANITGSLTISNNNCYSLENGDRSDPEDIIVGFPDTLLSYTEGLCNQATPVTTTIIPTTSSSQPTTPSPTFMETTTGAPTTTEGSPPTTEGTTPATTRIIEPGSPTVMTSLAPTVGPTTATGFHTPTPGTMVESTTSPTAAVMSPQGFQLSTGEWVGVGVGGVVVGVAIVTGVYGVSLAAVAALGACDVQCARTAARYMSCNYIKWASKQSGDFMLTNDAESCGEKTDQD